MDKEAFKTKGKHAIGKFLQHLQIYKSTADFKRGQAYFSKYLEVIYPLILGQWTIPEIQRNRSS